MVPIGVEGMGITVAATTGLGRIATEAVAMDTVALTHAAHSAAVASMEEVFTVADGGETGEITN
jgi:hypothetical protein